MMKMLRVALVFLAAGLAAGCGGETTAPVEPPPPPLPPVLTGEWVGSSPVIVDPCRPDPCAFDDTVRIWMALDEVNRGVRGNGFYVFAVWGREVKLEISGVHNFPRFTLELRNTGDRNLQPFPLTLEGDLVDGQMKAEIIEWEVPFTLARP